MNGARFSVRPVLPSDAAAVQTLIAHLSPHSRYRRFHGPIQRLSSRQLAGFVDVDHHERETLLAATADRVVGIGQYIGISPQTVEVAVVVADVHQRRGVGGVLAGQLQAAAREAGFRMAQAVVLAENRAGLRFVNTVMDVTVWDRDGATFTVLGRLGSATEEPEITDDEGAVRA